MSICRYALAIILLSACDFSGSDGGVGDPDAASSTDGASATDGASSVDTDQDGVADDVDNCPDVANMAQGDEDSDGTGDLCDNCPHLSNDQADTTETVPDGVGDACDPSPLTADTLVFEGFNGESGLSWTLGSNWTIDTTAGELVKDDDNDSSSAVITLAAVPDGSVLRASVRFVSEDGSGNGDDRRLASIVAPVNGEDLSGCGLHKTRNTEDRAISAFELISSNFNVLSAPFNFAFGTHYEVELNLAGGNVSCDVDGTMSGARQNLVVGTEVGLGSIRTQVISRWFLAITPAQ